MLALLAAMPEELGAVASLIRGVRVVARAGREFLHGELWGTDVVAVFSRWGKVAAASTATEVIVGHGATEVVFIGIAGALDRTLRPGDVVVARELYQHDLDASPFFAPMEVPLLGRTRMPTDEELSGRLLGATGAFLREDLARAADPALVARFALGDRRVVRGDVASGDQVVFSSAARERIVQRAPSAVCVEMEGAAVAQVCLEHGVRFACVRVISDSADETAHQDVGPFLAGLAGVYTRGIVERWLRM